MLVPHSETADTHSQSSHEHNPSDQNPIEGHQAEEHCADRFLDEVIMLRSSSGGMSGVVSILVETEFSPSSIHDLQYLVPLHQTTSDLPRSRTRPRHVPIYKSGSSYLL